MPEMFKKKSTNMERKFHVEMPVLPYGFQSEKAKTARY